MPYKLGPTEMWGLFLCAYENEFAYGTWSWKSPYYFLSLYYNSLPNLLNYQVMKTIKTITPTDHIHSAIGPLYMVEFEDGTRDHIYGETFLAQIGYYEDVQELIGKEINTEEMYFNFTL